MDCLQFGACTANVLSDMAGLLGGLFYQRLKLPSLSEELTPGQIAYQRNLQSFKSVLEHAARQIGGDVSLDIPEIDVSAPSILEDQTALGELEHAVEAWTATIQSVVDAEAGKATGRSGPLAEVEFWRERHRALSAFYEQLQLPRVQAILQTLKKVDAHAMISYSNSYGELQKLAIEAKDNTKFLATFERHFKTLSSGSFAAILDTLPTMFNAVRMVWIISRHYNSDARMVPLLERIAHKLAEKVSDEVNTNVLSLPPQRSAKNNHGGASRLTCVGGHLYELRDRE